MPAAEIAGLAIGTIALATLFSTCIELFDLFEVGKNCVYDYDIACTKISLLRERLRAWGETLRVTEAGAEDVALRDHWPTKREIVAASLIGLKRILCDTEVLTQKYNLSVSSVGLRRRTVWAIRDKAKFERLIQDISFLVDGLEKITAESSAAIENDNANEILYRRESLSDWRPVSIREKRNKKVMPLTSCPNDGGERNDQSGTAMRDDCFAGPSQPQQGEYIVSGTQYNRQCSIGIQGVLGHNPNAFYVKGIQVNYDSAVGIQGGASAEAVALLQRRAFARNCSGNTDSA